MSDPIDRHHYCKAVGISSSTLSRWIGEGYVNPSQASVSEKQHFTEQEVRFGRALKLKFEELRGQYTLDELAKIVRGDLEAAPFTNSPPGAPRPHESTWRSDNAHKGVRPARDGS